MKSHSDRTFAGLLKLATSRGINGGLSVRRATTIRHWNDKGALRMNVGMRVRGGVLAALIMVATPVAASLAALLVSSPAAAQTVDSIQVEGNRRVEADKPDEPSRDVLVAGRLEHGEHEILTVGKRKQQ